MDTILLLVSGATKTIKKYKDNPNLGFLLTPRGGHDINIIIDYGLKWAMDNDCFTGFNEQAFINTLKRIQGKQGCLFVNAPDVVGNAELTLKQFEYWQPIIKSYDLPVSLVAQDGLDKCDVHWTKFGALFIGGTTEFKLGAYVRELVKEARLRGKFVHMGRVNSKKRINYARLIGCNSVDGSGFSMFPDTLIPRGLATLNQQYWEEFA